MDRITIIGLGLIGGSLGLALRRRFAGKNEFEIVGHDAEPSAAREAKKKGAIDRIEWNLPSAVQAASLVIIATPVLAIREVMEQIAPLLRAGAVVTDTGSTKVQVMRWAEELLPLTVNFIGGHPMAGRETPGIEGAEADLFKGCLYCLVPSKGASDGSVQVLVGLVEKIGAKHYFLDADEHDGLVAAVSHLPLLLSVALVKATGEDVTWREMRKLAASGFRDVTRLASGSPAMAHGIFTTNREAVVRWVDRYIIELMRLRDLVAEGDEELFEALVKAHLAREQWLRDPHGERDEKQEEVYKQIPRMSQMLLGDKLAELLQREEELADHMERQAEDRRRGR